MITGPNIITDGLISYLDIGNQKSFRGEATTNTVSFPSAGAGRYNNPNFNGTIINTGEFFMGSPIWEVTFIPQAESFIPRLGSTEGFGFRHSVNTLLFPNTEYTASVYFKTEFPLLDTNTKGFNHTYSNIPGWGFNNTTSTRIQEGEWNRLYTKFFRNTVINGVSYGDRNIGNTLQAIMNTTQTTQVLVTITIQSNGTFSTSTDYGTSTAGGSIVQYTQHVGIRSVSPTITNNGGITNLSNGTSAIINHGLSTSSWTKISDSNPIFKTSYPFNYYVLMNIPSTNGSDATVSFRLNMSGFYDSVSDNKFWKVTFDTTNINVNDVIKTYWAAPMIEEIDKILPSKFIIGTRGTTVETGGGLIDLSKNGNNGNLINGVGFNSDNFGSIVFDGVDDYSRINDTNYPVNIEDPFSILCWIYIPSSAEWSNGQQGNIITRGSFAGVHGIVRATTNNLIRAYFRGQSSGTNSSSGVINRDEWTFCVATWDGSLGSLYINGVLSNSNSTSLTGGFQGGAWHIAEARASVSSIGNWFEGEVSNVKIYNKALTPEEILQNYNATKSRYGL